MFFHTSVYSDLNLAQVTNDDLAAATDVVLQIRNNHLIFSEPFNLLSAYGMGTTLDRIRFGNVALTYRGSNHIWPLDRVNLPSSRPYPYDLRDMPMALPMNEEITLEASTDAIGPADVSVVLNLAKPSWNMTLPRGLDQLKTRATVVIPATADARTWSTPAAVVMERDLYNGVYAVVGANVRAVGYRAFRIFFPSQQLTGGRQLRPGGLAESALGNQPWPAQNYGFGEWGRFHTFELPSIQAIGAAGGVTAEVRLDLVYLGADEMLLHKGGPNGG